ncbi:MAG TPA: hypothetical protein VGF29_14780 [Hyphomicrobiaceae bacterium]|jgi:hypothetical protein
MTTEDIAQNLEPDVIGAPSAIAPAARPRRSRPRHRPKIMAALEALHADGLLLPHLSPGAIVRLVLDYLMARGYAAADDVPGRDAIVRAHRDWLHERSAHNA